MQKKVLVVDDDKEVLEIISFVLKHNGFEVSHASNGQQLQHLLSTLGSDHSSLPDLIILDVMMPGENGYQICSALRNNQTTQHIPVMIITAHAEEIYERISLDIGAVRHITKPFHPLDLAERVKALFIEQSGSSHHSSASEKN
jgi:DNA-binding response OmpR family regulator